MCYIFTFSSFPTRERERERRARTQKNNANQNKTGGKTTSALHISDLQSSYQKQKMPPSRPANPIFQHPLDRKKWEVQAKSSVIFKIFSEVIQWSGTIIHRDITSSFGFGLSSAHIPPFVLKVYRSSTTLENRSTKL